MAPTPFDVESEVLERGIRAFTVRGELDLDTAPQLERPLQNAVADGNGGSIVIDLSECDFIDSTGIALIVRAWQQLDAAHGGGRLVLCCSNEQVQRLLKITGVDSSISVHRDREAALSALRG